MHPLQRLREEYHELPPWAFDGALALAVAVLEVSSLWLDDTAFAPVASGEGPTLAAVAVALLVSLPLTWRRVAPTGVFVVIGAGALLCLAAEVELQLWGLAIAVYSVAAHASRRRSWAVLAAALAGTAAALLWVGALELLAVDLATIAAAWVLGDRQRTRRAYTRELELRARQLEREREDKARIAVAEERGRIARELHDVVAHSVSVMVVQATAARRALRRAPDASEEALEHVEATGRQSLVELRRLLGLLRGGDDDPDFAPQPRLDEVPALVAQFRDAGLDVTLAIEGTARPLSSGVDLSAFRIVQEALTNALKHAGPASVRVALAYRDDAVDITVDDDGAGVPEVTAAPTGRARSMVAARTGAGPAGPATSSRPPADTPTPRGDTPGLGHGLVGMRERAALVGGTVEAGPRPGGGYRVRAHLPLDAGNEKGDL